MTTWPHYPWVCKSSCVTTKNFSRHQYYLSFPVLLLTPIEELQQPLVPFQNSVPLFKALFHCFHGVEAFFLLQFGADVKPKSGVSACHYNCCLLQMIKVSQSSSKRKPLLLTLKCKLHHLSASVCCKTFGLRGVPTPEFRSCCFYVVCVLYRYSREL